jgi:hypothetical protein
MYELPQAKRNDAQPFRPNHRFKKGTVTPPKQALMRFWPYESESLRLRWLFRFERVAEHPGFISQSSNPCLYFNLGTS